MHETKMSVLGFVSALLAMICACILIYITDQEQYIDMACSAIEANDNEIAKQYIDKIHNLNNVGKNKETVFMVACEFGNSEIIQYLLTKEIDVNYCSNGSLTPLELFCDSGYEAGTNVLENIILFGVKQSVFTEKPAVFYLAEDLYWMTDDQKQIAEAQILLMIQNGAPLGYKSTTILHEIAKADMDDLFDVLVHSTQGLALLNTQNKDGKTPWDVSVQYGAVNVQRVIRYLEDELREEQNPGGSDNWNDTDVWPDLWPEDDETVGETETESKNTDDSEEIEETTEEFNIDDYINDYLK